MMGESKVLQATGIYKGSVERGVQFFNVTGEDENKNTFSMHFMCKDHYTETLINAFKRLHPVLVNKPITPVEEAPIPAPEGEKTDG
jgi:hypothetical protein